MITTRKIKGVNLFITGILLLLTTSACNFSDANVVKGNGTVTTKSYSLGYFSGVELAGAFNVVVQQGDEPSLTIETDSNLQELLEVSVEQETLHISTQRDKALRPTKMDVLLTYPALQRIQVSGAVKLSSPGSVVTENLSFELSGASEIQLDMEVNTLHTQVAGAGKISFSGTANTHRIELAGASNLDAENLITSSTHITLAGAGSANVHATTSLHAQLSGVGQIRYYGNPAEKHISKSGIGSIRSAN